MTGTEELRLKSGHLMVLRAGCHCCLQGPGRDGSYSVHSIVQGQFARNMHVYNSINSLANARHALFQRFNDSMLLTFRTHTSQLTSEASQIPGCSREVERLNTRSEAAEGERAHLCPLHRHVLTILSTAQGKESPDIGRVLEALEHGNEVEKVVVSGVVDPPLDGDGII